ncbi:flagellar brake protein [Halobacillus litoralis]|uniref:flagellar brake protein n=1 Tax=Halobacillus litoralis TaxID=45668 RepID=UPI001CFE60D3|nr:flagellar brake domain-containing protein [Halobacillus litoralis]
MKIGTPLTLEIGSQDTGKSSKYKCKVVDIEDSRIYIDYPIHMKTGKTGFFLEGTQFHASFVGEDHSVYWFKTEVAARKKRTIPVIGLSFPGITEITRIQRRKYVRIEASVDVAVSGETFSFPTISRDISGGGMMFILPGKYKASEGEKVELTIVLPMNTGEYHYILTQAHVRRVMPRTSKQSARVSVEFENIMEKDRQFIIRYCFEQQMKTRAAAMN